MKGFPADADDARPCGFVKSVKPLCRTPAPAVCSNRTGRLKGIPADADDVRACGSLNLSNHCVEPLRSAVCSSRTGRLKGIPADADDVRPCGSFNLVEPTVSNPCACRVLKWTGRLKGIPADADDVRPCGSLNLSNHCVDPRACRVFKSDKKKEFQLMLMTPLRFVKSVKILCRTPAPAVCSNRTGRLKGIPADADDARPCSSLNSCNSRVELLRMPVASRGSERGGGADADDFVKGREIGDIDCKEIQLMLIDAIGEIELDCS